MPKPKATPQKQPAAKKTAATQTPGKRGGAREGAGRKNAAVEAATQNAHIILANARAKKLAHEAMMAELEFNIKSGQYINRDLVRQAQTTAFAACAQAMRSIQDNLERKHGVSAEVAEVVGGLVDEILAGLADDMESMHNAGSR